MPRYLDRRPGSFTRIGITGHQDLATASVSLVRAALANWLITQAPLPFTGITCLAPGAEQVFASLVLDLGGRLEVVIPAIDYRETLVEPADVAEFDRLLAAAVTVTTLGFRSSKEASVGASATMMAGIDMLVAVWDGHPADHRGAVGDVVATADGLGIPISIVWPTGATRNVRLVAPD